MGVGNNHIGCNVCDCKYHVQSSNSCSLSKINIIKNGSCDSADVKCTDCGSFEPKQS